MNIPRTFSARASTGGSFKRVKDLAAGALLLYALAAFPATAAADVVSDWNATAQTVFLNKGAQALPYYAMVHAAVYDAVNAIDGHHAVFAVRPTSNPYGASKDAAAAAAAYRVLLGIYPDQVAVLDPAYAASLAAVPDGNSKTKGIAIGEEVATAWLALRADDGREANVPYIFGTGPGVYQRTPPSFPNALTPWLAKMRPFALTSPSQFRAYGPPDLTSDRYAHDFALVKSVGALNSSERDAEETEIGRFYTESPTTFFGRNLRDFAATKNLGVAGNARLFAMVYVAEADSIIACWDSKYYYNSWRPITAIPAADSDGNPATEADAAWTPLANTPPHPEYPAGHGCVSTAFAESLRLFFGTPHLRVTLTSSVVGSIPHVFYDTNDMIEEVTMARVFGGMHFLTSVEHGTIIGKKVGRWVAKHYFGPFDGHR